MGFCVNGRLAQALCLASFSIQLHGLKRKSKKNTALPILAGSVGTLKKEFPRDWAPLSRHHVTNSAFAAWQWLAATALRKEQAGSPQRSPSLECDDPSSVDV